MKTKPEDGIWSPLVKHQDTLYIFFTICVLFSGFVKCISHFASVLESVSVTANWQSIVTALFYAVCVSNESGKWFRW